MPNWVYTIMNVKGSKAELQKFQEFAKGKPYEEEMPLDMNKFIQYPQKFRDQDDKAEKYQKKMEVLKEKAKTDETAKKELEQIETLAKLNDESAYHMEDGYNDGGYSWCISNWGTKWNFCDVCIRNESEDNIPWNGKNCEKISYSFSTAWSFPTSIALKMSEMFPTLEFEWCSEEESRAFNVIVTFKDGDKIDEIDVPFEDDEDDENEDEEENETI